MQGRSILQAKASLTHAISLLDEVDRFNIIAFNSDFEQLFEQSQFVSIRSKSAAMRFIDQLRADGGTEMYRPLERALMMNDYGDEGSLKQVIFITDGAVSNEFQLTKLIESTIGDTRLFTVGIGQAPNGYFMKKAAQFGRGDYVFIQHVDQVKQGMTRLMAQISQPMLTDIRVILDNAIHQDADIYPKRIADLYADKPLQIAIQSSLPLSHAEVSGAMANTPWHQQLMLDNNSAAKGISTLWARKKIADLLDGLVTGEDPETVKSKVLSTSLQHQVLSPYTSFIALEQEAFPSSLLAKNQPLSRRSQSHIPVPQTALGWREQFIYSFALLMFIGFLLWRFQGKQHHAQ